MHTCPNCGYCPHCGRRDTAPMPRPVYPYPWLHRPWYGPQPSVAPPIGVMPYTNISVAERTNQMVMH